MPERTPEKNDGSELGPEILAFYLPQFHQVPENDAWHGNGFTEWNVVARSNPLYPGHRQPDLPGELGFYDLRVPETRYFQARLAREHGITGFLYYHYWFSGQRMLERPLQEVLASGHPDFPFALCWANESWYRRWQDSVDEMLVEQSFSEEDDLAHIRWLIECFRDPRYIRIEGRPLLAIYRASLLPNPLRTVELWRRECEEAGMEPPWLVMFETAEDVTEPSSIGFDASAEFVPHRLPGLLRSEPVRFGPEESHVMYDYDDVAAAYLDRPAAGWQRYPCVATGWDNTPRRQSGSALILLDSTPEKYGRWLAEAADRQKKAAGRNGIVFVNAWNEWAEGAHLEPSAFWGRAYLEVTRDVLQGLSGGAGSEPPAAEPIHPEPIPTEDLYHHLYERFVALQDASSGFLSYADRRIREVQRHYESKLARREYQTAQIVGLNEQMAEQLQQQADRMRDLALPDVPETGWLGVAPPARPVAEGMPEDPGDEGAGAEGGQTNGETPSRPFAADEDERRRDEGHDETPGIATPRWLVELEALD